ncbi:MAG: nicotinate (nicotinamide) nucleotide adenylyltransferase [Zetaproteobacteria bacterium]|nr:nicotinate (nicotinamide) nucleotide adenylyltransferase [Zetaproteobacteria bacterium]
MDSFGEWPSALLMGVAVNDKKRVGIFGGSFDPPHVGHEALLYQAMKWLPLSEIWVVPTGIPVHRPSSVHVDLQQRWRWLEMIFQDIPYVRLVDWEMKRNQPTAAIDTLRWIKAMAPDVMPVWLMGDDAFAKMDHWVEFPDHLNYCSVAVFERKGFPANVENSENRSSMLHGWDDSLPLTALGGLQRLQVALPEVSSTQIRIDAEAGKSLQGLIPERIREEVEALYARKKCNR